MIRISSLLAGLMMGAVLTSGGCAGIDAGHEAVLVEQPFFFGHGGVDPVPSKTGRVIVAPTTKVIAVDIRPIQYSEHFDIISAENAPVYREVDLPLAATEHHIVMAQELLTHNKPKKAEATLEDAEARVEFISLRMDVHPIRPARQSLWHGIEAYAAGNSDAVKIDLNQAGVWLTRAVQTRHEGVKAEATALAEELRTMAGGARQKGAVVATALQGLWRKTTALTERETAVAVVRWQNFRKQPTTDALFDNRTKIKVDLTDANFHLTYAEIFEFTTHEPNKAQMALEKAQMHLSTAEKLANGRVKVKLEALEQESALIHRALMKEGQSDMSRYIKLKKDVHQILQELSW